MFKVLTKIAFLGAKTHFRQSLAVVLTMALAFFSLVVFLGYLREVNDYYERLFRHRNMLGDVIIENPLRHNPNQDRWSVSLSKADQDWIADFLNRHSDLVQERVRFLSFDGVASSGGIQQVIFGSGYDATEGARVRGESAVRDHQWAPGLARNLGCEVSDQRTQSFSCPFRDVQVSGMTEAGFLNSLQLPVESLVVPPFHELNTRYMTIPLTAAQRIVGTDKISFLSVLLRTPSQTDEFIEKFQAAGKNHLQAMSWKIHPMGAIYRQTMSFLGVFQIFIVVILFGISATATTTTTARILQERVQELATLRSIGFPPKILQRMIALEITFLSLAAIGIAVVGVFAFREFIKIVRFEYQAGFLAEPVMFFIQPLPEYFLGAGSLLLVISAFVSHRVTKRFLSKPIQKLFQADF